MRRPDALRRAHPAREYAWPRSAGPFLNLYDRLVRTVHGHAAALNPALVLRSSPPLAGAAKKPEPGPSGAPQSGGPFHRSRRTSSPLPAAPSTSPLRYTISPRRIVRVGQPVITRPACTE